MNTEPSMETAIPTGQQHRRGRLILNADDWGRDRRTTERMLDCHRAGALSSVSAMVFMQDSERAAELAHEHQVDSGLHLNLTMAFNAPQCSLPLCEEQARLARFLRCNRLAPKLYHPGLKSAFKTVVQAQIDEYERLYGHAPTRIDGHHHMHLCANVQAQKLLPAGCITRRNFHFEPGEKSLINRLYRQWQDQQLARRHPMADYFFDLKPIAPRARLEHLAQLAQNFDVEVETHPVNDEEYAFLTNPDELRLTFGTSIARSYSLRALRP